MQELDLKTIRQRAMRSLLQDGILEIVFGIYLLAWGVALDVNSGALPFLPFGLVFIPVIIKVVQRRFVYPRVGYADFGVANKKGAAGSVARLTASLIGLSIGVFAVLIWKSGIGLKLWSTHMLPVLVGVLVALAPLIFAFKYRVTRWYAFGALFIASGFAVQRMNPLWNHMDIIGAELEIDGGIALAAGLALFIRFLRRYPVQAAEVRDGAR
jgi:hypothetical protein